MRDSVRRSFVPLTVHFEGGYIGWMFPDIKGLVSTGFGLLLEPVALALALPWRRPSGALASREEIVADWASVKNHPGAARLGHKSVEHVARLRLDDDGLYQAFQGKMNAHDAYLRKRFPSFEQWPADAQLATHSMAWACGPAFRFPHLEAALLVHDFAAAAGECHMDEHAGGVFNAGLVPRNAANKQLYRNASVVVEDDLDRDTIYWPRDLVPGSDTNPEIRLDLLESEPPRAIDGGIVYALPDPVKPEPPDEAA